VAFRDPGSFDPFGWSVACRGRQPAAVREEVRRVVEWGSQIWSLYFPADRGYDVTVESPAGPSHGVQLAVRRGDFRAQVVIENIGDPARRSTSDLAVRMFGRAVSLEVANAEQGGSAAVRRARNVGFGIGFALFGALCWACVGVHNPEYFLGGLLLVVAGLMCTMTCATLGAFLGERVSERRSLHARTVAADNEALQDDLRRWRALVRQLSSQRGAIASVLSATTPFRSLPRASQGRGRPALEGAA
jgi:hypothetical protein